MDYLRLILILGFGFAAAFMDIRYGRIPNKLIMVGYAVALPLCIASVVVKDQEIWLLYVINVLIYTLLLLILYATKCFAGGDLKLGFLLSVLYPAGCCVIYGNSQMTLFFALGFSIFLGYCYLLIQALAELMTGRTKPDTEYMKRYLSAFLRSYLVAFLYITGINLLFAALIKSGLTVPIWASLVLCFAAAWFSRRTAWMRKRLILITVLLADIILSVWLKTIPFSLMPGTYLFALIVILCQMTITTGIYQRVPTETAAKGMILSTATSISMQTSRVRGLPGVSHEDLRDRLTEEQAASVRRWGKTERGSDTIVIMRKIPFAAFLLAGFAVYYVLWSVQG